MRKNVLFIFTLLLVTGCGTKGVIEDLENSLNKFNDASSIRVNYVASFDDGVEFDLIAKYDMEDLSFEFLMKNVFVESTFEDHHYYEKTDQGYNFFYIENNQWKMFEMSPEEAYLNNFMQFENELKNIFSFLQNIDESSLRRVGKNTYEVKIVDDQLHDFLIDDEENYVDHFNTIIHFEDDILSKISFKIDVYDVLVTYSWEVLGIDDYVFEIPLETLENVEKLEFENN